MCHLPVLFESSVYGLGKTHGAYFVDKEKLEKMPDKIQTILEANLKRLIFNKNKCKFLHVVSVNILYKLQIVRNRAWCHYR